MSLDLGAAPWYGAACPSTSISVLPMPSAARQQLVLARRSPVDEGNSISVVVTPDGAFWAGADDFANWGLPLPEGAPLRADGTAWYPLEKVRGLNYRFDACSQELWIDVSGVAGLNNAYDVSREQAPQWTEVAEPGGHLNFDLQYLNTAGDGLVSGTAELGAFTAQGHGASSFLYDGAQAVRLETQWTHDWPGRTERLTIGDSISRGGQVGEALRFGGVQWGTEFSLRPDLVTFPLPSLGGRAALPSTVDVYVNNVLRAQQNVPPGSFELDNVPVMTGAGNVQLVVRDLLGRSQIINYPFYASPTLLREGLSEYSVQAGALRQDFGFRSNDYGPGFAAGRLRNGLTDSLTSEIYGEAGAGQQMIGAGLGGIALPLGNWNAGLASSNSTHGGGMYVSAGVEHVADRWNAALQVKAGSRGFAQLGDVQGALRTQLLARLGFPVAQGVINFSYLRDDRRDRGESSIFGANYGVRAWRDWYLNAGVTSIFNQGGGTTATLGVTCFFDGDKTFSAQEDHGPGSQSLHRVSVQRDPPSALGLAYRLAAEQGSASRTTGNLRWTGEKGSASLDAERLDGGDNFRFDLSSGLALLGRDWFWTRPVDSSFAVVDAGAPDVRIYQDNHLTGRANADGLLLIPGLRAYQPNALRVDDADLPLRYAAQSMSVTVAPPVGSGVRARFSVEDATTTSLILKQANGMPVPVGAMIELDGHLVDLPVGYGGQALIDAAAGRHRLKVRWQEKQCATLVTVAPDAGADLPPQSLECR